MLTATADGKFLRFTTDAAFDSPSGAAGAVYGGSVNGRHYWRHAATGQRYGEWRATQIGAGGSGMSDVSSRTGAKGP